MPFPVDNIRSACAKKKTTLKQLEKDLGIGNGVIAKWENAKTFPPYDRLVAISEHLGVPVSYLTGETDKKESPTHEGVELTSENVQLLLSQMSAADLSALIADAASELAKRNAK